MIGSSPNRRAGPGHRDEVVHDLADAQDPALRGQVPLVPRPADDLTLDPSAAVADHGE